MALHGDDAYERKLRPVYDALDARSYKQAIKQADAALKKYKGDQLLRALKGYAMHRSGKGEEALQLMRTIVAEGPEAERVVMTMAYTYKAAGQLGSITQAYQAAAEKHPRDPEILAGLFKAHVREFDFVKQQQAAMKLFKLAPGGADAPKYSWWIVCSLALQARAALLGQDQGGNPLGSGGVAGAAPAGLPADKLLQLAETMAARQAAAAGDKAKGAAAGVSYEALLLYLDILQGQGKAAQAAQVLEGPLGEAVPLPADRLQLRAAALVRAGDLASAAACYRQALQAVPDDWLSWQLYLDCLLPSSGGGGEGSGGSRFPVGVVGGLADIWDRQQAVPTLLGAADAAAALAAAEETARELGDAVAASESWRQQAERGTLRAPHLWRCELALRRLQLGLAASESAGREELGAEVAAAFAKLAGNFSCISDLRPYLAALSGGAAERLAASAHRLAAELNAADGPAEGSASGGGAAPAKTNGAASSGGSNDTGSGGSSGGASGELRRLQRLVNARQLEAELLGVPGAGGGADATAHARQLLALYAQHMPLSASLDEKERGYGEELVALTAEALVAGAAQEAAQEARVTRLLQAVLVLEAAQQRRKVSAPLRLAAAALYSLLGAPKLAAAQLAALDVKSILHDSLTGHWLLPLLAGCGAAAADPELRRWVDGCAALHDLHQQEAGEVLGTALQHGTYSKVPEFVDFKERLQHSHTRALAAVAQALLPDKPGGDKPGGGMVGLHGGVGTPAAHAAALQHARRLLIAGGQQEGAACAAPAGASGPQLRFNEDVSTRPAWLPPGSASASAVAEWWQQLEQSAAQPAEQRQRAGYAHCWWARPLAAEAACSDAAAWRQRCLSELRIRLAWALAASSTLSSKDDAAALQEQLLPLVQPASGAELGAPAAACVRLQDAACRAALDVLRAVCGGGAGAAATAAQELAQACRSRAEQLAAGLAAVQGLAVLPGGVICDAAAFAADCQAAAALFARLKKVAAGEAAAAAGTAAEAAAAAAVAVKQAAAALAQAQDQQQRVQQALQQLEASSGSNSSSSSNGSGGCSEGGALWGFEPTLKPEEAVATLIQAQLELLQSMQ